MRTVILLAIAPLLLSCYGCGGGATAQEAETPSNPGLSSPRAAFESYAKAERELSDQIDKSLISLFLMSKAEALKPVLTTELYASMKKETDRPREKGTRSGFPISFEKEEKTADGEVVIFAKKKTVEEEYGGKSSKGQPAKVESFRMYRFHYVEQGGAWRVKKLYRACKFCDTKGLCETCGGTGKRKAGECISCKGMGKIDDCDCPDCKGTGMGGKPRPCFNCRENPGKCGFCEGKGWERQFDFKKKSFLLYGTLTVEPYQDLTTPANTAKSYGTLLEQLAAREVAAMSALAGEIRTFVERFFLPETLKSFNHAVKAAAEEYFKEVAAQKPTFSAPEKDGDTVVVVVSKSEKRGDHRRIDRQALKMVKRNGKWLVHDLGEPCRSCGGSGKCDDCNGTGTTIPGKCWDCDGTGKRRDGKSCRGCEGTGKTKAEECHRCKETNGNCRLCEGTAKFTWTRDREKDEMKSREKGEKKGEKTGEKTGEKKLEKPDKK